MVFRFCALVLSGGIARTILRKGEEMQGKKAAFPYQPLKTPHFCECIRKKSVIFADTFAK
jgi:hypothetical protein